MSERAQTDVHASMVCAALPLMVAVAAFYRPHQTTTHYYYNYWYYCYHKHTQTVFRWGFFIHFLKKSTLTLKLVYGLPTLLLLYVFPLEAITAQTTVPALTFSYGFITFGQRAGLFMSSMHCIRWETSFMILWSLMAYSLELVSFHCMYINLVFIFVFYCLLILVWI